MILKYKTGGTSAEIQESDKNVLIHIHEEGKRRIVTVEALQRIELTDASEEFEYKFDADDRIMANGYQSWTETKEFITKEHPNDLRRSPRLATGRYHFRQYGSQAFWNISNRLLLGFDYSYIKGKTPIFIGSHNYKNAYLLIWFYRYDDRIRLQSDVEGKVLQPGSSFTVFDYEITDSKEAYFEGFRPKTDRKLFGYTSWYNHYEDINEKLILEALEQTDKRFDLFQIDDGFETFVGDWFDIDPVKFPNGLRPIVDKIHDKGFMAGIWLAPFAIEDKSVTIKRHPHWAATDRQGKRIFAGSNWSGFYPLDLNNEEAVEYIRKFLRFYKGLGFDFFKLDFLYAVNLKRLKGKTRAETSEFACDLLRKELDDRLILGCGVPLSNAFEKLDYCRIGPDVTLDFDDAVYMRIFHPERTSTKVTIQNTIFRNDLDGKVFMNDPDVFLLRDDNIKLSFEQRCALTKINALFGSLLMTSDRIGRYGREKSDRLEEALELFHSAENVTFIRHKDKIDVEYDLFGVRHGFTYNIYKGTLSNER